MIALTAARRQRQADVYLQSQWVAVFSLYRSAHRLDIAAHDPQSDPKIARRTLTRRAGAALGIIAVEDTVELCHRHSGALVANREMGKRAVAGQVHQDFAAARRERDGIVDQVLDDRLD